ncbi:[acyl-carrier-protein] S-malonyltransferase [Apibacter muscae]|uniref:Malonyl CoA-acyl carrier protein transacylase n=1 Tax=Apibacter muscae TaxID=2509004 RepID=A0A563D8V7_9FLAO|nr:ACP S-malonyltransferase [Apibacter muscae]TWP22843.1 [acyl-carrier-protein] S-malonyltransferase [Apibacter muscae]TWP26547.1 [acyl-carrier-protein] S-malonyltransferase [Apibacter muscae]TWP28121.1 [acyl-carrier-protein] S-malonyltransferase [Apibacter muscae]
MNSLVFPGQGSQFPGMGKDIYDSSSDIKKLMDSANEILGFDILDIMFHGTKEQLVQTNVTQPAIFIYSVAISKTINNSNINMVAGHSLGEFSALVNNGVLTFENGLKLVYQRALAMQEACEKNPSTMAAILGLSDQVVEDICKEISKPDYIVVPANYNCPGQLVISGHVEAVQEACEKLKEAGAKRALVIPVGGAFHSPLMKPAQDQLEKAINNTTFSSPTIPIYQNTTNTSVTKVEEIKENLIQQLTSPVNWTKLVNQMILDGCLTFKETGPGKVLQGLIKKINNSVEVNSL